METFKEINNCDFFIYVLINLVDNYIKIYYDILQYTLYLTIGAIRNALAQNDLCCK